MINVPTGADNMHNTVDSLKIVALKLMSLIYQCTNPLHAMGDSKFSLSSLLNVQIHLIQWVIPSFHYRHYPLDTTGDSKFSLM